MMIRDRAPRSGLRVEVGLLPPVGSRLKDFRRRHLVAAAAVAAAVAAVVVVERTGRINFRQMDSVLSVDYSVAAGSRAGQRGFRCSCSRHCWLETGQRGLLSWR